MQDIINELALLVLYAISSCILIARSTAASSSSDSPTWPNLHQFSAVCRPFRAWEYFGDITQGGVRLRSASFGVTCPGLLTRRPFGAQLLVRKKRGAVRHLPP